MGEFTKTLDIWCRTVDDLEMLYEVQQLASMADLFQMTEVVSALVEAELGQLSLEACGEVLTWSGG